MFENLNQPYPFHNNFKHNLRTIALVCMGFILIVLYFQPFGINFLSSAIDGYFVLVIGIVSAITFFISTLFMPGLFPKLFESRNWTIKKELIWNFGMFLILISGFTITARVFDISGMKSLTLFRSGALALLPLILFNLSNYNQSLKSKVVQVFDTGRHWLSDDRKTQVSEASAQIVLESENGKEKFEGQIGDIVLIQSASNYIEIFYRQGTLIRKLLLRQTLSKAENVLIALPKFRKCHRCCLVNIEHVNQITGSWPNITLEITGLDFKVPVSRQNITEFRRLIPSL